MNSVSAFWLTAGVVTWPLLEYVLHRFLGHEASFDSKFRREHLRHHGHRDYFAGGVDKLAAALPAAAAAFAAVLLLGAGASGAATYTAGFIGCYLAYEWTHKRLHTHAPLTRLGLKLRKHHFIHHFADPRSNHGVTTTLFDTLFGTKKDCARLAVPVALAPAWMFSDDSKTAVAPEFASDFLIGAA